MFFCHQVSVHNHCHLNWRKLADLSHQHLYSDECLNVFLPVSDKICYLPSTICLDDFDRSKPEIRPASNVTMVVGSIYCDKIVHTNMHLLSSIWQTGINACSYASLKSNWALINRVEGTETVNFKMLKVLFSWATKIGISFYVQNSPTVATFGSVKIGINAS